MAYESIIVGSGSVFLAAEGTSFPDVDNAPGGSFFDLGEFDGGVTVNFTQNADEHFVDSETGPVKATRSQERMTIATNLAEATLENLAKALHDLTVTTDAGPPAIKSHGLYRGLDVTVFALLFRGESPYGAFNAQFQVPRAYQSGDIGMAFTKDSKTMVPVEFSALVDPTASSAAEKFGKLVAQTA